nr:hypothetical protein C25H3.4 - Caenorhabditis elegans [Caenorhabditis elegans]
MRYDRRRPPPAPFYSSTPSNIKIVNEMFKKPFTVKKNTNQRNSDSRKLFNRLKEEVNGESNIDKKGQVAQVKLTTFEGTQMNVYTIDKVPMLFEFSENGNIYPTVYYMWNNQKTFPVLICHEPVFSYLENGADLMLPGPSAVGCSMMSSEEMVVCGFKGKGVQVLHVFRDQLWDFGPKGVPPSCSLEDWNKIGVESEESEEDEETDERKELDACQSTLPKEEEKQEVIQEEPMENLLTRCFLAGLKHRFTRNQLPMDVGQFYTQCVLSCVPDGRRLDMKKTHFKKFATFLQEINELEITDERIVDEAPAEKAKFDAPVIAEYFAITEPTLKLFPGCSKGDLLTVKQIKEFVTKYVNENKLAAGGSVRLDPIIFSVTKIQTDTTPWANLMKEIHSRMTATWHIRWPDGREIVRKVSPPRVEFKIENRAGNKKVTLLNGLAMFGIDIRTICHQIQVTGVATSVTSQWEVPGVEGPQVLVQGNQIHFIADLLIKSYGIDKKFMKGTELAVKKKK